MEQPEQQLSLACRAAFGRRAGDRLGRSRRVSAFFIGSGGFLREDPSIQASRRKSPRRKRSGARRRGEGEGGDPVAVTMRSWRDVASRCRPAGSGSLTSSFVYVLELNLWFAQWYLWTVITNFPPLTTDTCRPVVVLAQCSKTGRFAAIQFGWILNENASDRNS